MRVWFGHDSNHKVAIIAPRDELQVISNWDGAEVGLRWLVPLSSLVTEATVRLITRSDDGYFRGDGYFCVAEMAQIHFGQNWTLRIQ